MPHILNRFTRARNERKIAAAPETVSGDEFLRQVAQKRLDVRRRADQTPGLPFEQNALLRDLNDLYLEALECAFQGVPPTPAQAERWRHLQQTAAPSRQQTAA